MKLFLKSIQHIMSIRQEKRSEPVDGNRMNPRAFIHQSDALTTEVTEQYFVASCTSYLRYIVRSVVFFVSTYINENLEVLLTMES